MLFFYCSGTILIVLRLILFMQETSAIDNCLDHVRFPFNHVSEGLSHRIDMQISKICIKCSVWISINYSVDDATQERVNEHVRQKKSLIHKYFYWNVKNISRIKNETQHTTSISKLLYAYCKLYSRYEGRGSVFGIIEKW